MLLNRLDCYYDTDSLIHKMNSTAKLICFLLFVIAIVSNDLIINFIFVDVLALLIFLSKIPLSIYLEPIIRLKFILLFVFILSLLCGTLVITSIVIVVKIVLIVWYLLLLSLTTSQSEITYSLGLLLYPLNYLKIPVKKLALFLSFVIKFIPLLFNQMDLVIKSYKSRTHHHRMIINLKAIIPSFRLTFKNIHNIKESMILRLYNYNIRRTNYRFNKVGIFDIIILLTHIVLLVLRFEV